MSTQQLSNDFPIVNPMIVYREEFDDWAVLFDPDSSETFALDPISSLIWKKLDGKHSIEKILSELEKECEGEIPEDAPKHIEEFIADLTNSGLVGYEENK